MILPIIFRTSETETSEVSSTSEKVLGTLSQNVSGLGTSANMIGGNVEGNVYFGNNPSVSTFAFVFILLIAMIVYQVLKNEAKIISK